MQTPGCVSVQSIGRNLRIKVTICKRSIDALGLSSVDTQKLPTPVAIPLLHKDLAGKDALKS